LRLFTHPPGEEVSKRLTKPRGCHGTWPGWKLKKDPFFVHVVAEPGGKLRRASGGAVPERPEEGQAHVQFTFEVKARVLREAVRF